MEEISYFDISSSVTLCNYVCEVLRSISQVKILDVMIIKILDGLDVMIIKILDGLVTSK